MSSKKMVKLSDMAFAYHQGTWAVHPMSVQIYEGERIGIIGESGAGKSTLVKGIFNNLSDSFRISGQAQGLDLTIFDKNRWNISLLQKWWGKKISFVLQEPLESLAPDYSIREQMEDILRLKGKDNEIAELSQIFWSLAQFPTERIYAYSSNLSGGENQRACLAMSMACYPQILIADEPTTGLDIRVEKFVIQTLQRILDQYPNMSLLMVTHSLGILNQLLQKHGKIWVLYQGYLLEEFEKIPLQTLAYHKHYHHPYTARLCYDFMNHNITSQDVWRSYIFDVCKILINFNKKSTKKTLFPQKILPNCCPYRLHCDVYKILSEFCDERLLHLKNACESQKINFSEPNGPFAQQRILCHIFQQKWAESPIIVFNNCHDDICLPESQMSWPTKIDNIILDIRNMSTGYEKHTIIENINLCIHAGNHLVIVGETGSGKTTLARALSGLLGYTQWVTGSCLQTLRSHHHEISYDVMHIPPNLQYKHHNLSQLVWQNPEEVFSPRETVGQVLEDACRVWENLWKCFRNRRFRRECIDQILQKLQLHITYDQYPYELSGGQRKRLLLARSFLASGYSGGFEKNHNFISERILYMDEPLRGIDVVNKRHVMQFLRDALANISATAIIITHDLDLAQYLCPQMLVLRDGNVVEKGLTQDIIDSNLKLVGNPKNHHPYTRELLDSLAHIDSFWTSTTP